MNKCINFTEFMRYLLDDEKLVENGLLAIDQLPEVLLNKPPVDVNVHPKWLLYSGLFVLLKQKLRLSVEQDYAIAQTSACTFAFLIVGNV